MVTALGLCVKWALRLTRVRASHGYIPRVHMNEHTLLNNNGTASRILLQFFSSTYILQSFMWSEVIYLQCVKS